MSFYNAQSKVVALAECYLDGGGDYLGQSISPGPAWDKDFKQFEIPKGVFRKDLFELFEKASQASGIDHDWEKVFVWTMAWGYGPGYGAYRTNKIRNHKNFEVVAWMKELSKTVNSGSKTSVEDAYKWLKEDWDKQKKAWGQHSRQNFYMCSPRKVVEHQ